MAWQSSTGIAGVLHRMQAGTCIPWERAAAPWARARGTHTTTCCCDIVHEPACRCMATPMDVALGTTLNMNLFAAGWFVHVGRVCKWPQVLTGL